MTTTGELEQNMIPEALAARRSVRKFRNEPVPRDILMRIIEAGTRAPSACNIQGWRFIIVEKPELRLALHEGGGSALIPSSPAGILVAYDNTTKNIPYRDDVQSAAACIQNMLLAAYALGLGACWICNLPDPSFVRRMFGMPWNYSPVAYLIIGYPADKAPRDVPRRFRVEDVVGIDCFPVASQAETPGRLKVIFLRIAYWCYRITPRFLKKTMLNRFVDRNLTKKFEN